MKNLVKKHLHRGAAIFLAVLFIFAIFAGCVSTASAGGKGGENASGKETPVVWDSSVKRGSLENGMSYFVKKNAIPANRILLRLVVKAGSCMEEDDQRGVAHFIEHLAFNGTENFEKSAIVDYFEKIGMNFGADLNAYTSFEETVYKLEIPADDPKMLETALLILHDWACAVTFPQEEIDKERGVVTEEWRLRQGLNGRISDKEIELCLDGSVYENRLPIGDMEIIKNISRDRILDFYNKWYRPDLMSVVAVGDVEPSTLEKAIKKAMGSIPAREDKIQLENLTIPYPDEKKLSIFKDPEMPNNQVIIFNQYEDYSVRKTEEDIQRKIAKEIAAIIFNLRLNDISSSADSPWIGAGCSEASFTNTSLHEYLAFVPKSGRLEEAMKLFWDEYDRFITFGVTEEELVRQKQSYLSTYELQYQNKDKTESSRFVQNLIDYVLIGKVPISWENYNKIYKKIIPRITADQVIEEARKAFGDRGSLMLILSPSSENLPEESEIMSVWKDYKNAEITAYQEEALGDNFMERPAKKAKVVSKKTVKELGAKEYLLENGIKIITKKTTSERKCMYMNVYSKGGLFQVDEEDVPSGKISLNYALYSGFDNLTYNQLVKMVSSKQIGFWFNIDTTDEYFAGNCKTDYAENLLQVLTLFFTQVNFNSDGWNVALNNVSEQAANHGSQPSDVFNDKINEILYGKDNVYYAPVDKNYLSKMNEKASQKVFQARYANPADFTYVFVGDFDESKLIELCSYYLGNLKTSDEREETVYKYWDFPEGKVSATVKKGLDEQGCVYMAFGGTLPQESDIEKTYKESELLSQLRELLDIRLREVIREDKAGSYGVSVNAYTDGYPDRFYRVTVTFGCQPDRAEELADEVINQIKKLQTEPISDDYIEKLVETEIRSNENKTYDNNWWLNRINAELVFTYEPLWVTSDNGKTTASWITAESLQEVAKKFLNTENYVTVYLKPEK